MKFKDMELSLQIKEALEKINFEDATDIQSQSIPVILKGNDVIGQAKTGTGKTFSFGLPMIDMLKDVQDKFSGLIICPTRELAIQVNKELNKITSTIRGIKTSVVYGGQPITTQLRDLKKNPQIIIGTPGRIMDHLKRKSIHFKNLKMMILDEADEMLKMGFEEDINSILDGSNPNRQTLLFSATMPKNILKIADKYLENPVTIKVANKELTASTIKQYYYRISESDKTNLLIRLLDFYEFRSTVIFCNTKRGVDGLVSKLEGINYKSAGLHGDLSQGQRDNVMAKFRGGNINVLVATDVAARGIDVKDIDVVFNFDVPLDEEFYVHRIGRTGRAGKEGTSITFVTPKKTRQLQNIERYINNKIEYRDIPSTDDIVAKKLENSATDIEKNISDHFDNKLYDVLTSKGYTDKQIVAGLINSLAKNSRSYPKIKKVEASSGRNSRSSSSNSRGGNGNRSNSGRSGNRTTRAGSKSSNFRMVEINIGKNEKLRPQILLGYLSKTVNLDVKSIGDIKIKKKVTVFELEDRNYRNFVTSINKTHYKGKQLKLNDYQGEE